ncbi:hypothetical protein FQA39_LY00289 [Lamprigera yunnana]|nr:hypothetical protein FQA39_LY00289 [Lamprigera yunnana]
MTTFTRTHNTSFSNTGVIKACVKQRVNRSNAGFSKATPVGVALLKPVLENIEKQILKSLDGKRFRADDIFSQLTVSMQDNGYIKPAKQMQMQFKTLRFTFNKLKRQLNKNGEGNWQSKFQYFEETRMLISDRPVVTLAGVDSASPDAANQNCRKQEDSQVEGGSQIEVNDKLEGDNVTVEEGEQPPQPKHQSKTGRNRISTHLADLLKHQRQKGERGGRKCYIRKRKESYKIAQTGEMKRKDEGQSQKDSRKRKSRNGGNERPDQRDDEKEGW